MLTLWIVGLHVDDVADEQQRFFLNVGIGLFVAGALYLLYLGLEPFVRRSWPSMLITWSRLLAGRLRDPLVGRDILVGATAGAAGALLGAAMDVLPRRLGLPELTPHLADLGVLMGARALAATILGSVNNGLQNAIITVFEFAVLRALFAWITGRGIRWSGRRWGWAARLAMSETASERVFVALVLVVIGGLALDGNGPLAQRLLNAGYQVVTMGMTLAVLLRLGIVASAMMFFVQSVLLRVPLTLDGGALHAAGAWVAIAAIITLAAAGFWLARAHEPLFGEPRGHTA